MSVKKLLIQLERHIGFKYPQFEVKSYSNRRNFYVHMGLNNALFGFSNYKQLLEEEESFINEHLPKKFVFDKFPKLINSTKWNLTTLFVGKKLIKYNGAKS